ncbi:hypothetical protein [Halomonas urumqiensis]|uniref:Uncharacterized protein n=1 Tax=Halomonas urumqiensis TaxID=1684789 RepID=A0A2N7UC68_9GAMM|nr:hypothetical protein [Halomonas urumqiensis]PMR78038.1 hypothetical protein C1H70_14735 [Halomonas urumqiensis]PTB03189.1 hypothetical protein C6V82_01370 [Halomonas urumqiensis]GHE20663.1 hypothetical protein GCM10017767_11840 [Halomonas urumqiensis]
MTEADRLSAALPGLRPADEVMRLERLGSLHATRLSFVRTLVRQMARQRWRISRERFDLDANGHGTAIYRLQTPHGRYHGVMFAQPLEDTQRSDRVIAEAWDVTFGLVEGDVDDSLLAQMAANVPLQEAGRQHPRVLVLSRANKSLRNFAHFVEALAAGHQPDPAWLTWVGYLYRTTAVYGNGKFGIADFARLHDNPDFRRPFSAQMAGVYLLRHFSIEQVEHLAACRAPDTACGLATELRRYLGIGNSTGLGMAPFLINHPQLIAQWIAQRETALALAMRQVPDETDRQRLIDLTRRAMCHFEQTVTEDADQRERNAATVAALPDVLNWLANVPLAADLWWQLVEWGARTLSLEAQELVNTLLIELYPDPIDSLEDHMGVTENLDLAPDMPLMHLRQLIETHYGWALAHDYESVEGAWWFWYRSAEKEEPRLGQRHLEAGAEKEMPIAIGPRVARTHHAIRAFLDERPRASVVDFLLEHPRHKEIVRRIQTLVKAPYGDIHANLWHRDMKPMHLLRTKLSFFGASRFDPKSDRWVRITLFQGAPLVEELNAEPVDLGTFDDWSFPLEPGMPARDGAPFACLSSRSGVMVK